MAWRHVGTVSIGPTDEAVTIGPVVLPPMDGIEVKVTQLGGRSPWPFSYGLLWVENSSGRELGTIKIWGHAEGDYYRIGAGMSSLLGGGHLKMSPRLYNLRWLKASGQTWTLRFDYDEPSVDLPPNRFFSPGFSLINDVVLPLVKVGTQGRLSF